MKTKNTAIVLGAGRGTRMNSPVAKQYLLINRKPVIYYSLHAFEICPFIDEVILVASNEDLEYCRREIVQKYKFRKVRHIIPGGEERYHSVRNGIAVADACDFLFIHDGARPFLSQEILERVYGDVTRYGACAAGMPVKDTIKKIDADGFCAGTPKRSSLWQIQTPQAFSYPLIRAAYSRLTQELEKGSELEVTDDAMVVETMTDVKVKLTEGSYENLKITTPEDLQIAENLMRD